MKEIISDITSIKHILDCIDEIEQSLIMETFESFSANHCLELQL